MSKMIVEIMKDGKVIDRIEALRVSVVGNMTYVTLDDNEEFFTKYNSNEVTIEISKAN